MPRRIGLFGGTFDPIHVGHLVAAANARYQLELDTVLFVVANDPWQKSDTRTVTRARDRLALVEAAVAGHVGLEASDIEIARGGASYTIETLEALRASEPDATFFLIVGADVVSGLSSWKRPEDLRRAVTLVVLTRPGVPALSGPDLLAGWDAVVLEIPLLEISGSDLRERAERGAPLDYLVPDAVIRMIRERGLYASSR